MNTSQENSGMSSGVNNKACNADVHKQMLEYMSKKYDHDGGKLNAPVHLRTSRGHRMTSAFKPAVEDNAKKTTACRSPQKARNEKKLVKALTASGASAAEEAKNEKHDFELIEGDEELGDGYEEVRDLEEFEEDFVFVEEEDEKYEFETVYS